MDLISVGRRVRWGRHNPFALEVVGTVTRIDRYFVFVRWDGGHMVEHYETDCFPGWVYFLCKHCGRPTEEHMPESWKCLFGETTWG